MVMMCRTKSEFIIDKFSLEYTTTYILLQVISNENYVWRFAYMTNLSTNPRSR